MPTGMVQFWRHELNTCVRRYKGFAERETFRPGAVQAAAEGVRICSAIGGGTHHVGIALETGTSVGAVAVQRELAVPEGMHASINHGQEGIDVVVGADARLILEAAEALTGYCRCLWRLSCGRSENPWRPLLQRCLPSGVPWRRRIECAPGRRSSARCGWLPK